MYTSQTSTHKFTQRGISLSEHNQRCNQWIKYKLYTSFQLKVGGAVNDFNVPTYECRHYVNVCVCFVVRICIDFRILQLAQILTATCKTCLHASRYSSTLRRTNKHLAVNSYEFIYTYTSCAKVSTPRFELLISNFYTYRAIAKNYFGY